MDRPFFLPLIVLLLGVGCSTPEAFVKSYMYPVRGPLALQKPIPVIVADVEGAYLWNRTLTYSGKISFSLPDGESFLGQWSREPYINGDAKSLALLRETDIAFAWDTVYGQGFYLASVMGSVGHARAEVRGSNGTTIQVEFSGGLVDPHRGVAMDGRGNIYKLTLP
jgi:hypothetical protein